jgi:hypothetical protein
MSRLPTKLTLTPRVADNNSSSQAICAELAHEHAIEDLHQITDHMSDENNPARGMSIYIPERNTQISSPMAQELIIVA